MISAENNDAVNPVPATLNNGGKKTKKSATKLAIATECRYFLIRK